MKAIQGGVWGLLLVFALLGSFGTVSAAPTVDFNFVVSTSPLWTDTGITVSPGDSYLVHDAAGTVSWASWSGRYFGPNGDDQPGLAWDEWITNNQHGQLIGFLGANPYDAGQNDANLFAIGDGSVSLEGVSGRLWLGFNDDFTHPYEWDDDNEGTLSVMVSLLDPPGPAAVPEPAGMLLAGMGLIGLAAFGRKVKTRR